MTFCVSINIEIKVVFCWGYILCFFKVTTFKEWIKKKAMRSYSIILIFLLLNLVLVIQMFVYIHFTFVFLAQDASFSVLLNVYIWHQFTAHVFALTWHSHNFYMFLSQKTSLLSFLKWLVDHIENVFSHLMNIFGFIIFVYELWLSRLGNIVWIQKT